MVSNSILKLYIGALADNAKIDLRHKTKDICMIRLLYPKYIMFAYLKNNKKHEL